MTLTVNTLADDPSGPSPGSTTLTLRDAITKADAGTGTGNQYVIKFARSLKGTINLTKALPFLDNTITIQGPGATKLTVNRTATAPFFPIFTVDKGETDTISGLTITGGDATDGGGIDNLGTLTVSKVTFTDNHTTNFAGGVGGGIDNLGTLTVTNSAFTGNSASGAGGGIYNFDALTVTGTTFTGDSSFVGGGIANVGAGVATVSKDTFSHDSAVFGGGIANFSNNTSTLIVSHSTFTDNSATEGGGIYNNATLSVSHSTFTGNSATDGGGIANFGIGTLSVSQSTFTDNSATDGGGIYNVGTLLVNTSNVFHHNIGGNIN
jgi:predicted outer membrane repeat protein